MRKAAKARKILGLALIATGLCTFLVRPRRAAAWNAGGPADLPQVQNARVETRALSGNLRDTVARIQASGEQPLWLAYAVDRISGQHSVCCGNWTEADQGCGVCRLEPAEERNDSSVRAREDGRKTLRLEQARQLIVLLRSENRRVEKIRVASEDCTLDAGGLPFLWITGVPAAESVAFLSGYLNSGEFAEHGHDRLANGALTAIALHGDPAADRAMESFVAPNQNEHLRKQAAFWLGTARGKAGLSVLERMANSDPSAAVRSQVAFAFEVSPEPAALDDLIRLAHLDASAHVRGQALFWLAQKAGQKAARTIQGAIDDDPDTEVKKKAVFALSQLPKDEGVPKLIEVAQNNRNPEVRKQAMFWLGQSHDPRALDFFEKILSR